jgi:putative toxin-antitoxin system antitoxin component (TIGR02293 family)
MSSDSTHLSDNFNANKRDTMPKIPTGQKSACQKNTAKPAAGSQRAMALTKRSLVVPINFLTMYRTDPIERVRLIKKGVPAKTLDAMAKKMQVSKERLFLTLGLAGATVNRKTRDNKPLSSDESSRVLGMGRLVGQVQAMVDESGNPEGFNAAEWLANWLDHPLPALGGQRPGELMDTFDGQAIVSTLISRIQSGAYA